MSHHPGSAHHSGSVQHSHPPPHHDAHHESHPPPHHDAHHEPHPPPHHDAHHESLPPSHHDAHPPTHHDAHPPTHHDAHHETYPPGHPGPHLPGHTGPHPPIHPGPRPPGHSGPHLPGHPPTLHGPPASSILHPASAPPPSSTSNKLHAKVEFDPVTLQQIEDTSNKGHSRPNSEHKKETQEIDLTGDHGKHIFSKNLQSSLQPLTLLLQLVGRFPLTKNRSKDHKTYEYTSICTSLSLFHFNVTTISLFYALITAIYSLLYIFVDASIFRPKFGKDNKSEEIFYKQLAYDRALIQRNAIPLIIVFMALLQSCISSVLFTRKHDYLAHIFTFLNKASYRLHMDLADKTKDFSVQSTVIFTVIASTFILFSCLKVGPSSIGTPTVFGSLMLRLFLGLGSTRIWIDSEPRGNSSLILCQIAGGIFLLTIFLSSIAPILLFIYKCKLVRNAFGFWNGRAYCALLRGMEHAQTEEARTTFNLLFKDHCILLDLLDSIDQMYSFTIESFFGLQVISLFFQMYFFFRTGSQSKLSKFVKVPKHQSPTYMRPYDWLPALIILFATSAILLCAGKAAAKVSEEAEAGMEVVRRKGVIGRRTDQELEFLYSMNYSFQSYKRMEISGAGYLYYNKGFIIQFLAVALFCFLLLCQFRPLLDYRPRGYTSANVAEYLRKIEGTSEHRNPFTNRLNSKEWALGY